MEGPRGFRVNVIDYDASTGALYQPADLRTGKDGIYRDPYSLENRKRKKDGRRRDAELVGDPKFHAQNVYAIVMRTLARFEFALGRRVAWGSDGHRIHIAPHAFAEANAFIRERTGASSLGTRQQTRQARFHLPGARCHRTRDHARYSRRPALEISRTLISRPGGVP